MLWATLWLIVVASAIGYSLACVVDRPGLEARPVLVGVLFGFGSFCAISTCVPIFAAVIPLHWSGIGFLVWEGGVALGGSVVFGYGLAQALRRRARST